MYRTFCNNLCCLFIAVILGGMTAGLVHFQQSGDEASLSSGFPGTASMVLSGLMNQDAVRSFVPSSEGSMETYSVTGSAPAPCQMSHKCQSQTIGCGQTTLAKAGHIQENTMSSRTEPSSRLADYYIFALGRIRV